MPTEDRSHPRAAHDPSTLSDDSEQTRYNRLTAGRAFATEFVETTVQWVDDTDQREPVYTIFPTGLQATRLFTTGFPTEVIELEDTGEYQVTLSDGSPQTSLFIQTTEYTRQRTKRRITDIPADPTERTYMGVVGKILLSEGADGTVYSLLAPESINTISKETRERWVIRTANQTFARCSKVARGAYPDSLTEHLASPPELAQYRETATTVLRGVRE